MLSWKRPAEASPDTRRLTCCEDISDIDEGRHASAQRRAVRSYAQQALDTVLIKQIIGSLPPYKREQAMKDLECLSATPKKKLWQFFSPTASQRTGVDDSRSGWLLPDNEPASVSKASAPKPSPSHLARGAYVVKCASLVAKHSALLQRGDPSRALRSPRPGAGASPRRRACQGKQPSMSMKKLHPGLSVIGGSAKLHVSARH
jgi:hypothetical protein